MKKTVSIVIAALCALCIAGLAGCGSGSGSAASASASASGAAASSASASSAAAQSDEELIRTDFDALMSASLSPEVVTAAVNASASDTMTALASMGMDTDSFVKTMLNAITIEAKDVKVDGDTAVLTAEITLPDFTGGEAFMNEKFDEAIANIDISTMSQEEAMKIVGQVAMEVISDPNMPKVTQTTEVPYNKVNGEWQIDEAAAAMLNSAITGVM